MTCLSFLSPIATLFLAWLLAMFLLFFPPLWLLWPILVIVLFRVNYLGIRYVLGHEGKARRWHHRFNVGEWVGVAILIILILNIER